MTTQRDRDEHQMIDYGNRMRERAEKAELELGNIRKKLHRRVEGLRTECRNLKKHRDRWKAEAEERRSDLEEVERLVFELWSALPEEAKYGLESSTYDAAREVYEDVAAEIAAATAEASVTGS